MAGSATLCLLAAGIIAAPAEESRLTRFEFLRTEMAAQVKIVFYCIDAATANGAAEAAFARIRQLNAVLSDYDSQSELRRLCDTSTEGKAIPVSEDLWRVLARAQEFSQRSGGAFDVTVGPVVRLWRRARRREEFPPADRLEEARQLVGYELVRLDPERRTVELLKPGMRLDLGGIGMGYAIDEALVELRKHGITRALIDGSGDIGVGDPPPDKSAWRIGIAPLEQEESLNRLLCLSNAAVSTSGDKYQFVELGGRRYSHIIDPRTGLGLTDHSSVTVIAADTTTADALASAVSVLGPEKGLQLIDQTPGAAALIVRAPEGRLETYESCRWKQVSAVPCEEK